jgi:hypothetical protein
MLSRDYSAQIRARRAEADLISAMQGEPATWPSTRQGALEI